MAESNTSQTSSAELPSANVANASAVAEEDPRWHVGYWGNFENFECRFCMHATLSQSVARDHYVEAHAAQLVPTGLLDAQGQAISRLVER